MMPMGPVAKRNWHPTSIIADTPGGAPHGKPYGSCCAKNIRSYPAMSFQYRANGMLKYDNGEEADGGIIHWYCDADAVL